MSRPIRVLHCLSDVGGNAAALAKAEREVGLDSTAVVLRPQRFRFQADEILCGDGDGYLRQELRRFGLLARAASQFDVVHFNFGRSILPPWNGRGSARRAGVPSLVAPGVDAYLRGLWLRDLPLLRALRKAIFVTYQGDDARQGEFVRGRFDPADVADLHAGYYNDASDRAKRRSIQRFQRYADGIYALNPDLLQLLPSGARFMPYASVDPMQWQPCPPRHDGRLLVLHAPTHRGIKGTRRIVAAAEELRSQGLPFDFTLVESLTHSQARELYRRADLVIDQLLVGWYGAFAVEAMAMAKPVICFVQMSDLRVLPSAMRDELPLIQATPASIESVLRDALGCPREQLVEIGRRSRAYVERWHDPRRIAADLAADYVGALRRRRGQRWLRERTLPAGSAAAE
jgi:glycosyltransferase involved in cell wall biosynthesis